MKSILYLLLLTLIVSQINAAKFRQRQKNKVQEKLIQKLMSMGNNVKLVKQGWLRISSQQLKNQKRYPGVQVDEKVISIKTVGENPNDQSFMNQSAYNSGYFRRNSQWNQKQRDIPTLDAFYFRLNGENLYYTETASDMVVLGAIAIVNVLGSKGKQPGCFHVVNQEADLWDLCTVDGSDPKDWICAISEVLGKPCPAPLVLEKIKKVLQPLIIIPLPSPDCATDFNYNTHGQNWVCRCNEGLEQSPIDLPSPTACLPLVRMNANFEYPLKKKEEIKVVYDRNMVRMEGVDDKFSFGKLTDIDGTVYNAYEIQFHTPAEHTMGGKNFDMEVQVIHRAVRGEFKQKAVLSMLYKRTPGAKMQFFEEFDILNLPNPKQITSTEVLKKDFSVMKMMYNDDEFQNPDPFNYYKYRGSFTSPPCEEDVIWFIASDPIPLGNTILDFIRDSLNPPKSASIQEQIETANLIPDNFDGNNREIQHIRSREVYFYDRTKGCVPFEDKKKETKLDGHYEKTELKVTKYFYVDSPLPSGLPNAFVTSEKEAKGVDEDKSLQQLRSTDRYNIRQ